MNVAETLLVFVGAPLAVVVALALMIYLPGGRKRSRYKPGQPWDHAPVWYEPHPQGGADGHGLAGSGPAAVPGAGTTALGSSVYPEQPGERALEDGRGSGPAVTSGAGGAHAAGRPTSGGPLGGARGTW